MPDRTVSATVHMPSFAMLLGCLFVAIGLARDVADEGLTNESLVYFGMAVNQFLMLDTMSKNRRFLLDLRRERQAFDSDITPSHGTPAIKP